MSTIQERAVESWDDDADFADFNLVRNAPLASASSMIKTSTSSRHSIRSESNAGEDDWQVSLSPNDDSSLNKAISSANDAGIPIPTNVPPSALLGGQIKRLGNKTKRSPQFINDDWAEDLGLPMGQSVTLQVKQRRAQPLTPSVDGLDDLDDWDEGSLGVRFGGTRRGSKNRSSSTSAMSPSLASNMTVESEEDAMTGLILPPGPLNLEACLRKRKATDACDASPSHVNAAKRTPPPQNTMQNLTPRHEEHDDFFAEIDIGPHGVFDPKKRSLNRNVKSSWRSNRDSGTIPKTQTTLTFTDKATTRIPRPVSVTKPARLEPVFESGATNITRPRRVEAATTSTQLLRSKRSMPALRTRQPTLSKAPSVPFLGGAGGGHAHSNSYHLPSSTAHSLQSHLRRESDTARPQSPTLRSYSRLSAGINAETPTKTRRDMVPLALARDAAAKRSLTRPARRRNFGDGSELDGFDDLPTSASKESRFVKAASARQTGHKFLRNQTSQSRLGARDRMATPLPPSSPIKSDSIPRFARDTAASRIAREQTLGPAPRVRGDILTPRFNWAGGPVSARSPQHSPTAKRTGRKGPTLINPMGKENNHHFQEDAAKKGMQWNAALCRWEGNDQALVDFEVPRALSPPRPALISNMAGTSGVQVVGGMVFDPQRMCWLKMRGAPSAATSAATEDEEDPFQGIEDLQDGAVGSTAVGSQSHGSFSRDSIGDFPVGEEFDLGPEFIRRQREEEAAWRARTNTWLWHGQDEESKWAIRQITMQ